MINGSCHCGAVRLTLSKTPVSVTDCNCSICGRLGALWAYFETGELTVEGSTVGYCQGDRTLQTHHCQVCGCTTHWQGLGQHAARLAVNVRMFDSKVWVGVPIRNAIPYLERAAT